MALLQFTDKGIYCKQADVYIDPWRPVKKALITHGHSDHSRWGHQYYLCTAEAAPVIRLRLGKINLEQIHFGETKMINGVKFSFHPAGHIIGSAQIRVEYKGEVWVASGDYKIQNDHLSLPFEPVKCHTFITESTFGLPVYKWKKQESVFEDINQWWQKNKEEGKVTVLTGYALGKAQRLLKGLNPDIGTIYTHGAIENVNAIIREQGYVFPDTIRITQDHKAKDFVGNLVLATPSAVGTQWMKRFKDVSVGIASGWMALRGTRRRRAVDRGFVLSDHADWDGLNWAIRETGAEKVIVTHGYTGIFRRWLEEQGLEAIETKTEFEGELSEIGEDSTSEK